jgi:hypothetical protein
MYGGAVESAITTYYYQNAVHQDAQRLSAVLFYEMSVALKMVGSASPIILANLIIESNTAHHPLRNDPLFLSRYSAPFDVEVRSSWLNLLAERIVASSADPLLSSPSNHASSRDLALEWIETLRFNPLSGELPSPHMDAWCAATAKCEMVCRDAVTDVLFRTYRLIGPFFCGSQFESEVCCEITRQIMGPHGACDSPMTRLRYLYHLANGTGVFTACVLMIP